MLALLALVLIPVRVEAAVRAAVAVPDARVELSAYRPQPANCAPAEVLVDRPVLASGLVVARFTGTTTSGASCSGAAFLHATVHARVLVAAQALRENDPIVATTAERELRQGMTGLSTLPAGARAARSLSAGQLLDDAAVRNFDPNAPVHVELRSGTLSVFAAGRRVPCTHGHGCAVLASGKRVEGLDRDGVLLVELP